MVYDPFTDEDKPARDFGPLIPAINDPGGVPLNPEKDLWAALSRVGGPGVVHPEEQE